MGLVQQYKSLLTKLLPKGLAWTDSAVQNIGELLEALAEELARLHGRELSLIKESDPRTTYEMLLDWEAAFGLPDACIGTDLTLQERLDVLYSRVTNQGGQSRQFFIDLAASLGYGITITEFTPYTVVDPVNTPLYGLNWRFAWQVNAPEETVNYFSVKSGVSDPLASWGNQRLECVISRMKPAHTTVLFSYGG